MLGGCALIGLTDDLRQIAARERTKGAAVDGQRFSFGLLLEQRSRVEGKFEPLAAARARNPPCKSGAEADAVEPDERRIAFA
jgi:hypothetical protein